jgi:hypothetical protein
MIVARYVRQSKHASETICHKYVLLDSYLKSTSKELWFKKSISRVLYKEFIARSLILKIKTTPPAHCNRSRAEQSFCLVKGACRAISFQKMFCLFGLWTDADSTPMWFAPVRTQAFWSVVVCLCAQCPKRPPTGNLARHGHSATAMATHRLATCGRHSS